MPSEWNSGLPEVTQRRGNEILFEVKVGDEVRQAYIFADRGMEWKDSKTFDVIPAETVSGWREPEPRVCRFGDHLIDEIGDRGIVTFTTVEIESGVRSETYACFACDRDDRIAEYGKTGIIRSKVWMDASMRRYEREYIREHLKSTDSREIRTCLGYAERLGARLAKEQAAYGQPLDAATAEQLRRVTEPLDAQSADAYLAAIEAVFCGDARYWFDRLTAEMDPAEKIAKVWEREVWFGGEDRSQDDRFTEPYSANMPEHRAYLRKTDGYGARADVLAPGSLQALVVPAKSRGFAAEVGGVKYMSYSLAGRHLFQIEDATSLVGFISDETSPEASGGIQGVVGRGEALVALFQRAIDDWKAGKVDLKPSDGVGLGF